MNKDDRPNNYSEDKTWIEKISNIFTSVPKTRKDINILLEIARENQIIDNNEFTIIEGAMEVNGINVREVMIPRNDMKIINADNNLETIINKLIESRHSRFPVIGDSIDDIIGILHAKDLLPFIMHRNFKKINISSLVREVHKVPESQRLNKLLENFRKSRQHMAIVIDEYGSVSGLITIEDVLEEIVGEIKDEFDLQTIESINKINKKEYIIKAQINFDDFNNYFNTKLNSNDCETIAGIITSHFGYVPKLGESFKMDNMIFNIMLADEKKIDFIRLLIEE